MIPTDSDHEMPFTYQQREEILNRVVPGMIKNFNGDYCVFWEKGIRCRKCPFGINQGEHCDLRAVLALLIDDMKFITSASVPHLLLEPDEDDEDNNEDYDDDDDVKPASPTPHNHFKIFNE